jgi:hypothetical protein
MVLVVDAAVDRAEGGQQARPRVVAALEHLLPQAVGRAPGAGRAAWRRRSPGRRGRRPQQEAALLRRQQEDEAHHHRDGGLVERRRARPRSSAPPRSRSSGGRSSGRAPRPRGAPGRPSWSVTSCWSFALSAISASSVSSSGTPKKRASPSRLTKARRVSGSSKNSWRVPADVARGRLARASVH